jgi:hypothetical protein
MFKNLLNRQFVPAFVVALTINLLIITLVFSSGVYTGFEGTFGLNAKSFGDTVGSIFGSFTSFILFVGAIVTIAIVLKFTHWLAGMEKKIWIILWVVVVAVLAAFVGPSIVHVKDFNIAFVFFLVLLAFSAVQTWIFSRLFAPRASTTKTVVKTATTKSAPKPATK